MESQEEARCEMCGQPEMTDCLGCGMPGMRHHWHEPRTAPGAPGCLGFHAFALPAPLPSPASTPAPGLVLTFDERETLEAALQILQDELQDPACDPDCTCILHSFAPLVKRLLEESARA